METTEQVTAPKRGRPANVIVGGSDLVYTPPKTLVKWASVIEPISVPGLLNSEVTLSKEKVKNILTMEWSPLGLIINLQGGKTVITPHQNVRAVLLA